jgi:hypothetical protein
LLAVASSSPKSSIKEKEKEKAKKKQQEGKNSLDFLDGLKSPRNALRDPTIPNIVFRPRQRHIPRVYIVVIWLIVLPLGIRRLGRGSAGSQEPAWLGVRVWLGIAWIRGGAGGGVWIRSSAGGVSVIGMSVLGFNISLTKLGLESFTKRKVNQPLGNETW